MTNSYPSGSPGVPDSSMPTGAPGFVPRRSSYASVVSGTASGAPYQQPARSGAFSHLLNQSDFSYDPSYQGLSGHQRFDPRTYDMDFNANGSSHGRSGSWGRGGQLHPFSSAFAALVNGSGYGGFGGSSTDQFFIPSYLKGSRYVQRLEEAHKAKVAAQRDGQSAPSSQPGSLSTSASSINLHAKMGSSYRGIAHDVIEKAPPAEDETLTPLPSKWNILDKYGGLEVLNDGLEVKLSGPKSERDRDHEACSLRADHPMPSQCGIYYFEVDIVSRKREEYVSPFYAINLFTFLTSIIEALLVLVSQRKMYHYQDYLDGNQNRTHITEMMATLFAAKAQANTTVPHLMLET